MDCLQGRFFCVVPVRRVYYWQVGLPRGNGIEQVLVAPFSVMTAVAVAVPL